jgi:hypothetical protein
LRKSDGKAAGQVGPTDIQQATFLSNTAELLNWRKGSLLLAKHLTGMGTLHAGDPGVQFALQASNRQLGKVQDALDFYTSYCAEYDDGPWREIATTELWFNNPTAKLPPRPVARCRFTTSKPLLDGKFDDACWQGQQFMVLKDALRKDGAKKQAAAPPVPAGQKDAPKADLDAYATEAMLAYDAKFLYIALRCKHPVGQKVPPAKERPRDADLHAFDRVSILLDLDRDYSTCFRLEVDQRGCACEDCWGDKTWNPQWYVAVHSDEDCWCVEAAIPLLELTGDRVMPGTAWACNIVRTLPGRGLRAWSLPAGVEPRPEGMGLMVFQQDR